MVQARGSGLWRRGSALVMSALVAGTVVVGGVAVSHAQTTGTPVAGAMARPAHIHSGDCANLGDVVAPLNDLTTATGTARGQSQRAAMAESSLTNVPLTLDQILAGNHAINVHLSADQIGTYVACGEIGGVVDANGALTIGLRELNNSGFTGIAYLAPGTGGASTNVSVFIAQTGTGTGTGGMSATSTTTSGSMETPTSAAGMETPTSAAGTGSMETPTTTGTGGMETATSTSGESGEYGTPSSDMMATSTPTT